MLVVDFFTLKLVICWSRVGQGQSSKKGGVHTLQYVYPLVPILLETFLLPSKTIYFWDLLVKDWSRHDFFSVVRDWSRTQTRGKRKTLVKCWSRKRQNMHVDQLIVKSVKKEDIFGICRRNEMLVKCWTSETVTNM